MLKLKGLSKKRNHWYLSITVRGERVYHNLGSINDPIEKIVSAYNSVKADYEERKDKLQPLARVWLVARQREVEDGLLSPRTLLEYSKQLAEGKRLDRYFGKKNLGSIKSHEIQSYLDTGKRYQSNREIATLSQMIGWAVNRGHLDSNPCLGVKRNRELARDRYVTDSEFAIVYEAQPQPVKDLMMMIYLTGLRPGDALAVRFSDCFDEWLYCAEGKTGKKVRF